MQTKENVKVQCVFKDFVNLCDEVPDIHGSLVDILPDEKKHNIWVKVKMISNNEFISNVPKWLSGAT